MTPFQIFAVGLVSGTFLQALGLGLCLWRPHSGRRQCAGLACWALGVLLLLLVAVYDRDVTLFAGQTLAAFGFWKIGWVRA